MADILWQSSNKCYFKLDKQKTGKFQKLESDYKRYPEKFSICWFVSQMYMYIMKLKE